jgi:hypothetical protein
VEFWENIVSYYLTVHKQFPVLWQAAIQKDIDGHRWNADLDFLALDFSEKKICLVEVRSSSAYREASTILERLAAHNCKHIENYVRKAILQDELGAFTIKWWFFVRRRHLDSMKSEQLYLEYLRTGGCCEITALQDIQDRISDRLG